MHKIFFDNRCISISHSESGESDIHSTVESFKSGAVREDAVILAKDCEAAYRKLLSEFKEVNAAGGLVSDGRGNFLMIYRNGLWDLPKGHQEAGEDISETAIREVGEETGLQDITLGELICVTDHCYLRNGIWHLKHTWWFRMSSSGKDVLRPQTEEDISEASWSDREETAKRISSTYPSIAEVFENIGFMKL